MSLVFEDEYFMHSFSLRIHLYKNILVKYWLCVQCHVCFGFDETQARYLLCELYSWEKGSCHGFHISIPHLPGYTKDSQKTGPLQSLNKAATQVWVTGFIACDVNVTGSRSLPVKIMYIREERSGHENWIFSNSTAAVSMLKVSPASHVSRACSPEWSC